MRFDFETHTYTVGGYHTSQTLSKEKYETAFFFFAYLSKLVTLSCVSLSLSVSPSSRHAASFSEKLRFFSSSSSLSFSLSLNYSTVLSRFLILFLASPSPLFSRGRVENRTLKASMISIIQIQKSSVFLNVEISISHFFEQKSKQAKESEHASMHACWCWAWNTRAKRTWPRGLK